MSEVIYVITVLVVGFVTYFYTKRNVEIRCKELEEDRKNEAVLLGLKEKHKGESGEYFRGDYGWRFIPAYVRPYSLVWPPDSRKNTHK